MSVVLRLAAVLAPRLGVRWAPAFYAAAARVAWRWLPGRAALERNRAATELNLKGAREALESFGRYLGEFLGAAGEPERVRKLLGERRLATLRAARAAGHGALVVTMHYGNWELGALALAEEFGPINVIVRETGEPRLDALIRRARGANRLLSTAQGLRPAFEALGRGEIVAAAIDEPREQGTQVRLLGATPRFPDALFKAAVKSAAVVLPIRCGRTREGLIEVETGPPAANLQEVADRFAEWLRADPDQWVMMTPYT